MDSTTSWADWFQSTATNVIGSVYNQDYQLKKLQLDALQQDGQMQYNRQLATMKTTGGINPLVLIAAAGVVVYLATRD